MYQHCVTKRRATEQWADGQTKEKVIKPRGTQCNAKCEWALDVDRPRFKGLPIQSSYGNDGSLLHLFFYSTRISFICIYLLKMKIQSS